MSLAARGIPSTHRAALQECVRPRFAYVAERWDGKGEPGHASGGRVEVRLGGLLAAVDEFARRKRINRAEAVRRLVGQALQRMDG
jgi:hypothetical protein